MSTLSSDSAYQAIVERLEPGAKLISHRALMGGVSAHINALTYTTSSGFTREVVVRRHGSAHWKPLETNITSIEHGLQTALHNAGIAVPEPLLLDTSNRLLPTPFLVMALVDGTTSVASAELHQALDQMADFLAGLHALDAEHLGLQALPNREDPVAGALTYLPDNQAMATVRQTIRAWRYESTQRAVLHGDFWPGNVLWQQGQLAAVIDWEDAALGDALSDLAACRAELTVMYGEPAMVRFTQRYLGLVQADTQHLALWDVYVSSAALATMADWGLTAKEEHHRRAATSVFLEQAIGRLTNGSLVPRDS